MAPWLPGGSEGSQIRASRTCNRGWLTRANEKSDLPLQVAADLGQRDLSFMEDRFGSRPSEEVSDEESIERLRALGYLE